MAVRNAAYSQRPILPRGFFPIRGDGHLCFKSITSLCCPKAGNSTQRKPDAVSLTAERQKKDAHQKWRPPAAAFGLFIVLSILSLTYGDFAFNSKTLPIFSQYSCMRYLMLFPKCLNPYQRPCWMKVKIYHIC